MTSEWGGPTGPPLPLSPKGNTVKTNKILGREPAVFWALVAGVVLALLQLIPMPSEVNGALNAAVLAAAGLVTAAMVATDKVLPALVGLIQATFAVFLAFGSPVPETTQTGILALVAAVASFFVRQNVVAPVDDGGDTIGDRVHQAYQRGFEQASDQAVPVTSVESLHREGGAHGLTDIMEAVRENPRPATEGGEGDVR